MRKTSLAILTALACTAAALAVGEASAQQGSQPSPVTQLDAFVGDGVCSGSVLAIGKKPGHATTGRYHGERTLDGHWVVLHYDEERSATNPKPFSVVQYVGYDPGTQHFVSVTLDNSENGYSTGTSPGWEGATITFDETARVDGKQTAFRDVFTHGESGMSSHVGMIRDDNGTWTKTDEETCRKP